MSDINTIIISGRLTQDPVYRTTPSGVPIADLTLAHNTTSKNAQGDRIEKASYLFVTAFKHTADFAMRYLTKGRKILVQGSIRQESWQDQKTGQPRHKTYIIADQLQFLDAKPQDAPNNQTPIVNSQSSIVNRQHQQAKQNGYQPQQNHWQPQEADNDIPF